jgi:nitrogen regulatory protein P-II 1
VGGTIGILPVSRSAAHCRRHDGEPVKKIEAIFDISKLDSVRAALDRVGVDIMTVIEVRGYERGSGRTELSRGAQHKVYLVTKVKVEIMVEHGRVPALEDDLVRVTRTGRFGDSKIFVMPVEGAVCVKANGRVRDAL